ncbi:hypothetical protein Tco_1316981 [Tanacetum coccineum]
MKERSSFFYSVNGSLLALEAYQTRILSASILDLTIINVINECYICCLFFSKFVFHHLKITILFLALFPSQLFITLKLLEFSSSAEGISSSSLSDSSSSSIFFFPLSFRNQFLERGFKVSVDLVEVGLGLLVSSTSFSSIPFSFSLELFGCYISDESVEIVSSSPYIQLWVSDEVFEKLEKQFSLDCSSVLTLCSVVLSTLSSEPSSFVLQWPFNRMFRRSS